MTKKIIFSTGGTGGHIFPAINLMKYFSQNGYEVLLITDKKGDFFLKKYSEFKSVIISSKSPINKSFFKKILSYVVILYSILKSILILLREKPILVFGFGGYVSFPICFASRFFKVPLVIYENNLVLGRANKKLLPISKRLLIGTETPTNLPEKYKKITYYVGNILREEIINHKVLEKKYKENFFSLLVLGGSQGAEIFGKIIPSVIKMLKDQGYEIEISQQCLQEQKNSITSFYNKNKIKNNIFEFSENILSFILSSDLVISRGGASTTAELVQTQTPFIAVPLPHSMDNHQYLNAKYYSDRGCCWIIEQHDFSVINLFNLIVEIIKDRQKLKFARENMKKNDYRDVYNKIDKVIKEII